MTIERWDPFSEMLTLRDAMNRLIEESFVRPGTTAVALPGRAGFRADLRETENEYVLEASLPGVKPEDIDISVEGNQVSIRAETKAEEEKQGERYLFRERSYGRFQRTLTLPTNIQADQVNAELNNGILTLTLPKAEEARPRRIQVRGGGQSQQLEAGGQQSQG
jgi:HSP20 family protein